MDKSKIVQERFLKLFNPCDKKLWAFCLNLTHNKQDAEDLYSETILLAFENLDTIIEKKAFLAYIFQIAYRLNLAQRKRNKRYTDTDFEEYTELIDSSISLEQKTDIKIIFRAIKELKSKYRQTFLLSVYHGFSRKEIAKIQNISEHNVKIRLYRAKKQIRFILNITDIDCE